MRSLCLLIASSAEYFLNNIREGGCHWHLKLALFQNSIGQLLPHFPEEAVGVMRCLERWSKQMAVPDLGHVFLPSVVRGLLLSVTCRYCHVAFAVPSSSQIPESASC